MKFNNELYRNIFIIAEIFIPAVITLLYFLIIKKKYNKAVIDINENQRKFKKEIYILKILFVLIISILLIFGYCKFINHNFFEFYDRYGNLYSDATEIPLYDENGVSYTMNYLDPLNQEYVGSNGNVYSAKDVFLTEGGFIVNKNAENLEYVDYSVLMDEEEKDYYVDDLGNKYYLVGYPRWDSNGKLWLGYDKDLYSFDIEIQNAYCQKNNVTAFNDAFK